jgi:hypothetical protein
MSPLEQRLMTKLQEALKPYKRRPITPELREEMKRKAIAVFNDVMPVKMNPQELSMFIDKVLDEGVRGVHFN